MNRHLQNPSTGSEIITAALNLVLQITIAEFCQRKINSIWANHAVYPIFLIVIFSRKTDGLHYGGKKQANLGRNHSQEVLKHGKASVKTAQGRVATWNIQLQSIHPTDHWVSRQPEVRRLLTFSHWALPTCKHSYVQNPSLLSQKVQRPLLVAEGHFAVSGCLRACGCFLLTVTWAYLIV